MSDYDDRVKIIKKHMPEVETLEGKLLEIAGERLAMGHPCLFDNAKEVIEKGSHFNKEVTFVEMIQGQCHENVEILCKKDPKYKPATGWALSGGCWRQHSWAMDGDNIVETTSSRDEYFGYMENF